MSDSNPFHTAAAVEEKEEFVCPECRDQGVRKEFDDARGLGTHRRIAHGVMGSSTAAVAYRAKKAEAKRLAKRKAAGSSGRPLHPSDMNQSPGTPRRGRPLGSRNQPTRPGSVELRKAATLPLPATLVGYAMAKMEEAAHRIARDNNLPERDFTRVVAGYLAEFIHHWRLISVGVPADMGSPRSELCFAG